MDCYYLTYASDIKTFVINDMISKEGGKQAQFGLSPRTYQRFGCKVPLENAPIAGFLLGRDGDCYAAGLNYVMAMVDAGFEVRFLTYEHCETQLEACQCLILPGGVFVSPEAFYTDPQDDAEYPTLRSKAYITCICTALQRQMPILGICAGAQMVAGEFGMKLYRSFDYIETPIKHSTDAAEAHRLNIFPNTPLERMFGGHNLFFVNSRHQELLAPIKVQREILGKEQLPLDIYAEANDGSPEAWGSEEKRILCVQWHPEDMYAAGSTPMLKVFLWLRDAIG